MSKDKQPNWTEIHQRCHEREQRYLGELIAARAERDFWRQQFHNRTMALRGQQKGLLRAHRRTDRFRKQAESLERDFKLVAGELSRLRQRLYEQRIAKEEPHASDLSPAPTDQWPRESAGEDAR